MLLLVYTISILYTSYRYLLVFLYIDSIYKYIFGQLCNKLPHRPGPGMPREHHDVTLVQCQTVQTDMHAELHYLRICLTHQFSSEPAHIRTLLRAVLLVLWESAT